MRRCSSSSLLLLMVAAVGFAEIARAAPADDARLVRRVLIKISVKRD